MLNFLRHRIFVSNALHIKSRFLRIYVQVTRWMCLIARPRVLLFDILSIEKDDTLISELSRQILHIYPETLELELHDILFNIVKRLITFHSEKEDSMTLRVIFNSTLDSILDSDMAFNETQLHVLQLLATRIDFQEATTQLVKISMLLDIPQPMNKFRALTHTAAHLSRHSHAHVEIASNHIRGIFETFLVDSQDINEKIYVANALVIMSRIEKHLEPVLKWKAGVDGLVILPPLLSRLTS